MPHEKQFNVDDALHRIMEQFWSHGYEATSMQDVVDCTGLSRGSLYATFGDKHDMFLAALRRYDEKVRAALLRDLRARYDPRETIRQLLMVFASPRGLGGHRRGCFITNTALELSSHDAKAAVIVAAAQRGLQNFLTSTIREGIRLKQISAGVDPKAAASSLLASLIGLMVLSRSRPERKLLQNIVTQSLRVLD